MLRSKLNALFRAAIEPFAGRGNADLLAKERLQALRESELSVGAHLKRGIPVARAWPTLDASRVDRSLAAVSATSGICAATAARS